ncbi:hypothetical protein BC830DRAFT_1082027 [Chytriomyces sp. MP71]|nr:hypothetical protein BC830DRAFT_1082027 [Chytriomyces sp. MP71]
MLKYPNIPPRTASLNSLDRRSSNTPSLVSQGKSSLTHDTPQKGRNSTTSSILSNPSDVLGEISSILTRESAATDRLYSITPLQAKSHAMRLQSMLQQNPVREGFPSLPRTLIGTQERAKSRYYSVVSVVGDYASSDLDSFASTMDIMEPHAFDHSDVYTIEYESDAVFEEQMESGVSSLDLNDLDEADFMDEEDADRLVAHLKSEGETRPSKNANAVVFNTPKNPMTHYKKQNFERHRRRKSLILAAAALPTTPPSETKSWSNSNTPATCCHIRASIALVCFSVSSTLVHNRIAPSALPPPRSGMRALRIAHEVPMRERVLGTLHDHGRDKAAQEGGPVGAGWRRRIVGGSCDGVTLYLNTPSKLAMKRIWVGLLLHSSDAGAGWNQAIEPELA